MRALIPEDFLSGLGRAETLALHPSELGNKPEPRVCPIVRASLFRWNSAIHRRLRSDTS